LLLLFFIANIDQAKQRKVSDKKVALSTIKPNQTDKRNQLFNDLKNKSKWHTIGTVQKILRNRQNQHPTHDQFGFMVLNATFLSDTFRCFA
jgi:hypothetical protein